MLQAKLLGHYEIRLNDQPVILSSRPIQSIFAYLLLHPNTTHRREKLAGQFWPESSEVNARSNLRHSLWCIRKALGLSANTRIVSDDLGVTYHPQSEDELDVETFENGSGENSSLEKLLLAVTVYEGDLLPGCYEEWVILERERLHAAFERGMGRLLDGLLVERRWNEVLEWGERWIASGSIPEPAFRSMMLADAELGNHSGAAALYQRCVDALARELGVEPSGKTRQVFEEITKKGAKNALSRSTATIATSLTLPAYLELPEKPAPIFVGRETELTALDGYLQKALHGHIQVVFVSGEAGSGKSSLLQEFLRKSLAAHSELLIGWGICNTFFGQGVPYLPFRDVLNMLAGGIEPLYANGTISRKQAIHLNTPFPYVIQALLEQGSGLLNDFLSTVTLVNRVATLLPNEASWRQRIEEIAGQKSASDENKEKTQLFEMYSRVLHQISIRHPLLIILDDLHWMDSGTGQLFFHLISRLQNSRILIAGAYRSEDVALGRNGERHLLEPLLNELQTSFGNISIDLDRSRETSGRNFIDAFLDTEPNRLDAPFRQELYLRTHGHPLFTLQLLRNLQEQGEILPDEQGRWIASTHINWGNLPPQVEGIIGERIGRLSQDLQDLLMAASVEGEQFTVQVLERVQGTSGRVLLRLLSHELEKRHHLVQEMGETYAGGVRLIHFRFVHSLIQQFLYRELGAAERIEFHREIAETLEMLYKEDIAMIAAQLAYHYREAGVREKAVEYLLQAGDQARSLYAHQEAIHHYQEALIYLKEIGAAKRIALTLMKLYLVFHSSFDFNRAQMTLQEYNSLWQHFVERNSDNQLKPALHPYRLSTLKAPNFDPSLVNSLFDLEWLKELFCGLAECSEDRNVIPMAADHWEVLDDGRRYVFHLRQDLFWSDNVPVTAGDFEFAWKRALDPANHAMAANLLYDIRGAKDFNQGYVTNSDQIGIDVPDPFTLIVELEEPCGYFPYIFSDPVSFAVPKHIVERDGEAWTEPGRIVTNGAFTIEYQDQTPEKTIHFTRNPRYSGDYKGNIDHITLSSYQNELEIYNAFVAGKLDFVEFLIPQIQEDQLNHYRDLGQLHISSLPFVDAIYFVTNRPPFDNPDIRRAFVLATDREKLAREIKNQLPATGGYIPPGLPGHSAGIGLPYNPQEAQRILAAAGYPQGHGFPSIGLLIGLVGLEKGDNLVFAKLQEMWEANLGITIQKCWDTTRSINFKTQQNFNFFFVGWLADFPDPASFLQANHLFDQIQWHNATFDTLVEAGRHTLDQDKRLDLYRQADHILMNEAVVLPLFYGHIYELSQPWVHRITERSIYSPQWKDITVMPY